MSRRPARSEKGEGMSDKFRIEKNEFEGDSIEAYCYGDIVTIEIDEPWAGSTETGFGQTCSVGLSLDEAERLANYILSAVKAARAIKNPKAEA
jgi:hypothetical protein